MSEADAALPLNSPLEPYHDQYKALIDNIRDYGIFLLAPEGTVRTWNHGAQLIQGYRAEEILGKHIGIFYPPAEIEAQLPQRELKRALIEGKCEEEGWRLRKDGSMFWANIVITPLHSPSGFHLGFTVVTRDLTDRAFAEKALKESEEKFRLMVEAVRDYVIIMLDPAGRISSWNVGAERIKGWTEQEILGSHFSIFYTEEDRQSGKVEIEINTAIREGRFEDYGWRVKKDGTRFFANVILTALRDERGKLKGFCKITRDITEKMESDEALKKAYTELESFTYSVSHDLRAPLRRLEGFSDILLTTQSDHLDESGKHYLQRVRESAQRMSQLINDLLNLSKIGQAELTRTEIHLSDLAERIALDLQRPLYINAQIKIQKDITASADASLVKMVLHNLFENAFKYSSKNENPVVEFGAIAEGTKHYYFIRDNGVGYNEKYTDRLFSAFQRLHATEDFPGHGVGLATVKRIIDKHGGQIWSESKLGHGATFYFTLANSGVKHV